MFAQKVMKHLMHWFFLFKRPMTLGVRVLATNDEGAILLVRHSYVDGWHLPGGGVERGQTASDAAIRELLEETGFTPMDSLQLVNIFLNPKGSPRDHVVLYMCRGLMQLHAFESNAEIVEIGFFQPDALPDETTIATRERILEGLNGSCSPSHW